MNSEMKSRCCHPRVFEHGVSRRQFATIALRAHIHVVLLLIKYVETIKVTFFNHVIVSQFCVVSKNAEMLLERFQYFAAGYRC
jgi:hypothetical protein